MSPADWAALIPAVVALLTAVTALVRLELHHRSQGTAVKPAAQVPDSHDQSCTERGQ